MSMKLNESYYALVNAITKGYAEKEVNCRLNEFIKTLTDFSANKPKVFSVYRALHLIKTDIGLKRKVLDQTSQDLIDRIIGIIETEIDITQLKLKNPELIDIDKNVNRQTPELLNWTDDKIHLVALIYAIAKSINNGNAKIKQIVRCFEYFLQIKLGNVYDILQDLNIRKEGPCSYLEKLPQILQSKMDELNSKK